MAPTTSSDPNPQEPPTNNTSTIQRKRTRSSSTSQPASKWSSDGEAKTYSSRLLDALRRVSRAVPSRRPPGRAVRDAADRVLATAARGRTRWSRAILSSRHGLKLKLKRRPAYKPSGSAKKEKEKKKKKGEPAALERKRRVLGRLVPGAKRLGFPALLEETCDYIQALEMQVKAMSALAQMLAMAGGESSPSSSAPAVTPQDEPEPA